MSGEDQALRLERVSTGVPGLETPQVTPGGRHAWWKYAMRVNEAGRAYVTPAVLKGKQLIRVSVGATATERKDVELVWHELRQAAEAKG